MIQVAVVAPVLALRAGLAAIFNASDQIKVTATAARLADLLPLPTQVSVVVVVDEPAGPDSMDKALVDAGAAVLLLVSEGSDVTAALAGSGIRAWGVLPLDTGTEQLHAAVIALGEGLVVVDPALLGQEIGQLLDSRRLTEGQLVDPLTERELQVLQQLAQGLANKQIARALEISEHTVKFHISAIYNKLGAASRTEAVRKGVHQGLITL